MKRLLTLLAGAALFAVGCQEETAHPVDNNSSAFTAVTEDFAVNSKTSIDTDRNILWSKNDQIAIFMDSQTATMFELADETAGTSKGKFTLVGTQNGKEDSDRNVAIYPYQNDIICSSVDSDYQITDLVLPESQAYAEGSFGNRAFFMAAFSQNQDFSFKNISGALKLQLTGDFTIKSIKLEGNNGEKLAGNAAVTVHTDGTVPSIVMADDASTAVTIDCGEGVNLSSTTATSFFFALPPVSFSKGFTLTLTRADGKTTTLATSAANEIKRSTVLAMPLRDLTSDIHLTFTESDAIIANPERGFYAARSTTYPLNVTDINAKRLENITIFHIGYQIPAEAYIPESSTSKNVTSISRIKNEMQMLRDNGAKCVIRFSYSDDTNEKPWDATPEWVAKHIAQIKPILQEYGDVIITFQAGYVGVWGEWYYTDHFDYENGNDNYALRKQVIDAMLEALPSDRTVALRTPLFKKEMYAGSYSNILTEQTAYDGSALARLSCFNDCFLASSTDQGTFSGNDSREYWKNETKYVFMGGETCAAFDDKNWNDKQDAGEEDIEYCKCNPKDGISPAVKVMEDYHWSYLNMDYNQNVINNWSKDGCMNEIQRRLGYRLSLTDVYHSRTAVAGGIFSVNINIKNSGFAAPMNGRGVELILVDKDGKKTVYDLSKEVDPRYWFAGDTYTFEKALKLPEDAAGECTMYLNLPDPKSSLHNNPKYSIRLANDDTWNESTGYNKLFEFTVLEKTTTPEPDPVPGEKDDAVGGEDVTIGNEFNPWGEN